MSSRRLALVAVGLAAQLCACSIGKRDLPMEPPPLADLEEPLDRREEPRDEDARRELAAGSFTGITVGASSDSLDALASDAGGLAVRAVVENSPADFAGAELGDLVVEVRAEDVTSSPRWPSEWRAIELATAPGASITVVVDRAGVERELSLTTMPRVRPAEREVAQRFREDVRVGVVLRTATEVEARAAGLGPGGGAVVVGLSRASPWRTAGIRYGDLVRAVDGVPVAHPQVVLDAIRGAEDGGELKLEIVRDGATLTVAAGISERAGELREIDIPLLYSYSFDRGRAETSFLFGLYHYDSTPAAWRMRLLWFIEFEGGDADRLESEESSVAVEASSASSDGR